MILAKVYKYKKINGERASIHTTDISTSMCRNINQSEANIKAGDHTAASLS